MSSFPPMKKIIEHQKIVDEKIAEISEEIDSYKIEKKIEGLKAEYSSLWTSAAAYTNLIVIAGYAGFFGLISMVKDHVAPFGIILSSFFIVLSLAIFVSYEIIKMVHSNHYLENAIKKANENGEGFIEALANSERQFSSFHSRVWKYTFYPTVIFGLLGILIILVCFVISLNNMIFTCVG